jgi:signal transduction histidine kinase
MTSAGLGLSLVKRIVELQGDSVRIEDSPTGGACLVVTLHESRAGELVNPAEELSRGGLSR